MGNDPGRSWMYCNIGISIHVPSWGTTGPEFIEHVIGISISIHVPSWGTTHLQAGSFGSLSISIHVPSWGTTNHWIRMPRPYIFQSTFPRGERQFLVHAFHAGYDLFQSTFPRGERPPPVMASQIPPKFQSTFPRGERQGTKASSTPASDISIHVPSWGTTVVVVDLDKNNEFQSTFPRGERRVTMTQATTPDYFNPRSLVGNDDLYGLAPVGAYISIHVPSWGTTANFHKYSLFFYAINIIFLLFIIPSLFSLVLFMLLF